MFTYTQDEVTHCFTEAKNLNAAVKHILRSDTSRDPKLGKFLKAFRSAIKSPNKAQNRAQLEQFVEKALPEYEEHLYLLNRNAYADQIDIILDQIIAEYAEDFNQTYSLDQTGTITVEDGDTFEKLGKSAIQKIISEIPSQGLPASGFMNNTVAYALFEGSVLEELRTRLGSELTK